MTYATDVPDTPAPYYVDVTQAPHIDVTDTRAPGVNYVCEEHNDLGDNVTGNVSFQNYDTYHTECWHIECDKDVVISFSNLQLYSNSFLHLYSSGNDSGNAADFTLEKWFNNYDSPMDVVLNGSAFVQFRSTYYYGWSRLDFSYVCVDVLPTQAPPTDVPDTRAPGVNYVCDEHNDLGDNVTGNVSFQNYDTYHTECWHIECDKDVVISFSTMQLYSSSYLGLYTGNDSGNGTDFTLEKWFNNYDSPMDVVLNGSAFVQFRSTYYTGWSRLEFNYVCVDATTQSPPTAAPNTRAPGVNYVCEEHNDLGDNVTGIVSFQNYDSYHTECWHIECDKDVVISFSHLQLYSSSYLDLYTSGNDSGNATDFTLEKRFNNYDSPMDVVLNGSAFVQFRSTYYTGWSSFKFNYVCVDATTQTPPTAVPDTRAPGVSYVCEEHNDLGDNVTGNVSFQNYDRHHTECWHIECDKDVVISFSNLQLYSNSFLDLHSSGKDSGNGKDFTLEKRFNYFDSPMDVVLNGSAFVQFTSTYYYGWSRLEFDYVCVDATQAPPTDVPDTRAPGVTYVCEEHNDLGDNVTGNVSFQNYDRYHTECWHIECDKDVVISFSNLQLYSNSFLHLYSSGKDSGNATDFTLEKWFNNYDSPMDVVLNGSAFVQFRSSYYTGSRLEFNYVCVDATTQAPPTDVPDTRAPGVNYVCEEHHDLGDNVTGNVSFQNYDSYHTECWHIECDKDVVISFSTMNLSYSSYLDLYTSGNDSGNATDFTLEKRFYYFDSPMDVVLNGSAFVQFRSSYYSGSALDFNYVCVDATTQAPYTAAPNTRAPGVNYVCEAHNDRIGTGYVNFENYNSSHTECWHIECDYDVVLKFSDIQLYYYSYVSIYSSGNGTGNDTNFNLEHDWSSYTTGFEGVELVVSGSAFVQFRSTYYYGRSYLAFQYECRAPTPPPQQQCGVDTVPQRCGRGTSRACAFEVRHPARLLSVAFSWDGRRVATGSADRFVRVFDARTGVRVGQLGCADGFRVHDIAFSPDNNLVALAGEGGRVVVCDAMTGVLEATLVDMSASGSTPVHRVEFTRDGRYVVSGGGQDARTRVFDMLASDRTKASSVINHHARNVGFSVDGAHLATVRGSEVDEVTTVWGLDGSSAVELPSVSARVTALSFSSFGGNALLRGMSDGTILVSQLPGSSIGDGSAVDGVSLSMLSGAVHDSKFSRDGKMIAAVGEGDVMVWSHDGSVLHDLLGHSQAVLPRLDFSPDGTRLATVSRDGTLVVWKL